MNRLTVARARALKEPGMYRADPTLYLNVAAGGSKSWIQRIAIHGKRRDIGLGGFPLAREHQWLGDLDQQAISDLVALLRHLLELPRPCAPITPPLSQG